MELSMTVLRCPDQVAPEARTVSGGEFHVGRGPDVDWVLPDHDRLLSKRHFAVAFRGGAWQVADTSTNGTFLNAEPDPIGRGAARSLRDGDRLRLGAYEIEVRLVDQPSQAMGQGMSQPRARGGDNGFGGGGSSQSPFSDPFSEDLLAPSPAARRPFDEPAYRDLNVPPTNAQLPHDFDPLAPDHDDSAFESDFRGPVQSDHSSSMEDAMIAPVAGYTSPREGGIIPADDLLPDDWDKDLLEGITPPAPPASPPPPGLAPPGLAPPGLAPPGLAPSRPVAPTAAPPRPARPDPAPSQFATPPPFVTPPPPIEDLDFLDQPDPIAVPERPPQTPPIVPVPMPPPVAAPVVRHRAPRPAAPPPVPLPEADPFSDLVQPPAREARPGPPPVPVASPPPISSGPSPFDEPTDPQQPEPAAPARPAGTPIVAARATDDGGLLEAFLKGARLSGATPSDPAAMMTALGKAFRATVSGVRATLIARATIKSEFRIDQTMIQARGNNPLKFSADDDDALTALLGVGRRIEMAPATAIEDSLRDIRMHEVAVMAAMQVAIRAMLDELGPDKIRARSDQGGMAMIPAQRKARAWDAFEAQHAAVVAALSDDFDSIFGKAFVRAYERALDEISTRERP